MWELDDKYLDDHNQDVVEAVFNDECKGRGYARRVIFAGVQTEFKDCNGENIYTGDVIKVEEISNSPSGRWSIEFYRRHWFLLFYIRQSQLAFG